MSDFEYVVDDRYQTQEAIRTISISFQPHLPFTEAYSMSLMNQGGSETQQDVSGKSNYFRLGPKDLPGSSQAGGSGDYPMRHKREIYRSQGSIFPRLVAMSKSQNRESNVLKVTPNTGLSVDRVSRRLASLLNVDPLSEQQRTNLHTPMASRDQNELELRMIAQGFDNIAKTPGGAGQNLNKKFQPEFTDRSGKGFDMDLTKLVQLKGAVGDIMGSDFDRSINDLEVSTAQKPLLQIKNSEKLTENNKKRWVKKMDKLVGKYNKQIKDAYAAHEKPLESGFMPTQVLRGADSFDYARSIATTSGDKNTQSDNYNIRQFLDRFIRNKVKPYYFESSLGPDRFGLVVIKPSRTASNIPQFELGPTRVITAAADLKAYLAIYMVNKLGFSDAEAVKVVNKAYAEVRKNIMLTEANIATLEKHAHAQIVLDASHNLNVNISQVDPMNPNNRGHAYGQVFKIQNTVAKKLLVDIKSYFSTNEMKGEFAKVYRILLEESNKLTKSWFRAASELRGKVTYQPLSTEFKYGKAWDGPRKKYLGVWSSPDENTWRGGDTGYNFSLSPMLESRRELSNSKLFTESYD